MELSMRRKDVESGPFKASVSTAKHQKTSVTSESRGAS